MEVARLFSAGVATVLLAAGLAATTAPAKEAKPDVRDRGCGDDDGNDRCSAKVQGRMRALYRLPAIETFVARGEAVRRAMIVDGYGRDLLAISLIRGADGSARIELHAPCASTPGCAPPLVAPLDQAGWDSVARIPQGLANGRPHRATQDGEEVRICMHSWVVVLETADRARPRSQPAIRQATESACGDGPAIPYVFNMAEQALASLPDCQVLKAGVFRNTPSLLAACTNLRGVRRTAAEAYLLGRDLDYQEDLQSKGVAHLFASSASSGPADLAEALIGANIYWRTIEGNGSDHARMAGRLYRYQKADNKEFAADLEIEYVRQNGRMLIASYRLGEFKPVPQDD